MALLADRLATFQPQTAAVLDEVVVTVPRERLVEVLELLKGDEQLDFNYLRCLSVVDYKTYFEVVYHLWSLAKRHKAVVKVRVPYEDAKTPSVIPVYRGADWYEREGHDLFGLMFEGHPNLKPLLLYEGFDGYPGRKSFPFHEYNEW